MKTIDSSKPFVPLSEISVGNMVQVLDLINTGLSRRRLLDLGIVPGTFVEVLRQSPLGDPVAYKVRDTIIALRKEESRNILIKQFS